MIAFNIFAKLSCFGVGTAPGKDFWSPTIPELLLEYMYHGIMYREPWVSTCCSSSLPEWRPLSGQKDRRVNLCGTGTCYWCLLRVGLGAQIPLEASYGYLSYYFVFAPLLVTRTRILQGNFIRGYIQTIYMTSIEGFGELLTVGVLATTWGLPGYILLIWFTRWYALPPQIKRFTESRSGYRPDSELSLTNMSPQVDSWYTVYPYEHCGQILL